MGGGGGGGGGGGRRCSGDVDGLSHRLNLITTSNTASRSRRRRPEHDGRVVMAFFDDHGWCRSIPTVMAAKGCQGGRNGQSLAQVASSFYSSSSSSHGAVGIEDGTGARGRVQGVEVRVGVKIGCSDRRHTGPSTLGQAIGGSTAEWIDVRRDLMMIVILRLPWSRWGRRRLMLRLMLNGESLGDLGHDGRIG